MGQPLLKPGYKTTEFWTNIAVLTSGAATTLATVFDQNFVNHHVALSTALAAAGVLLMAVSQAAYSISRGLAKQGFGATTVTPVEVSTGIIGG